MNLTQSIGLFVLSLASLLPCGPVGPRTDDAAARLQSGKELFTREWLQGDKRSFAGDGLGPVFNEKSCSACHRQGGIGGSGARGNNATIVSAFVDLSLPSFMAGAMVTPDPTKSPAKQPDRKLLAEIHPALLSDGSFPLHRFGPSKEFEEWKKKLSLVRTPGWQGGTTIAGVRIALIQSDRNTPALFGASLIEGIPEPILREVASEQGSSPSRNVPKNEQDENPRNAHRPGVLPRVFLPISGRISLLKDGKVGRFGWKASVASLHEFTLQACSSELGLEVPGFHRAPPPWVKNYKAPGLDLSADQCKCLTEYVASLPRPTTKPAKSPQHGVEIAAGQKLFESTGCAICHRPKLGDIEGIYSDLLLHDMGPSLSAAGSYGTNVEFVKKEGESNPLPINRDEDENPKRESPPKFGAGAREWRTPPLWGLRDSAPYLHDGRAETIVEAIIAHNGEGTAAARLFEKLTLRERSQLEMFLKSLVAPSK